MSPEAVGGLGSTAQPVDAPKRIRFPCFDGFRAIAAISVLVTHVAYLSGFNTRSALGAFTARMDVGVAVFFLISGFLLYRPFVAARYDDRPREATRAYFWRRALRIFPAYWLALTITIFVLHVPSDVPSAKDLLLYYSLTHLYSLGNIFGPILSSYTLVTEVAFYVFLPIFVFALSHVGGAAERRVRFDLIALAALFVFGVTYRIAVAYGSFGLTRMGQLENILPGWIDVFSVGMVLAVVSAWLSHRDAREPIWARLRVFPAASWSIAVALFVVLSLWIGRPPSGSPHYTFWEDLGIHYFYLAIGFFFLLPGIFGPQRSGRVRRLLQYPAVQWLGLISYGLYLWNETWLEKYVEWSGRANGVFPEPSPFWTMFLAVFALSVAAATVSYYVVERPALRLKSLVPGWRSVPARRG
ncbi:MAG TPA: acyltransferase [Acidimicrobiia bacterium]|nr:acyltransferase [Acidimicrobiia bacterium]